MFRKTSNATSSQLNLPDKAILNKYPQALRTKIWQDLYLQFPDCKVDITQILSELQGNIFGFRDLMTEENIELLVIALTKHKTNMEKAWDEAVASKGKSNNIYEAKLPLINLCRTLIYLRTELRLSQARFRALMDCFPKIPDFSLNNVQGFFANRFDKAMISHIAGDDNLLQMTRVNNPDYFEKICNSSSAKTIIKMRAESHVDIESILKNPDHIYHAALGHQRYWWWKTKQSRSLQMLELEAGLATKKIPALSKQEDEKKVPLRQDSIQVDTSLSESKSDATPSSTFSTGGTDSNVKSFLESTRNNHGLLASPALLNVDYVEAQTPATQSETANLETLLEMMPKVPTKKPKISDNDAAQLLTQTNFGNPIITKVKSPQTQATQVAKVIEIPSPK